MNDEIYTYGNDVVVADDVADGGVVVDAITPKKKWPKL